jgi:hypothetical protein
MFGNDLAASIAYERRMQSHECFKIIETRPSSRPRYLPYGTFSLLISIGDDLGWLAENSPRALSSRAFVVSLLQRHLLDPQRTLEEVNTFPDGRLQAITIAWLNAQKKFQVITQLANDATLDEINCASTEYATAHILPRNNHPLLNGIAEFISTTLSHGRKQGFAWSQPRLWKRSHPRLPDAYGYCIT